jgi:ABC-type sugar transport system ATPase subunit
MNELLKLSSVSKTEGDFVLESISFSQQRFQKIAIAGETGSGKSTLLKIIAGLIQPDAGEVLFEGARVAGPHEKLVAGHSGIAYLSQNFELPKFLRVEQVLNYANTLSPLAALSVYEICQIDHLYKRRTDQLSGGERQRIAMARLLISSPGLLLLDEPFSHLDMVHKNTLKTVIRDIGKKLKINSILVSHDPADTLSWADVILVLKDGKLIQSGMPETIYRNPVNEYVAGLFGKYTLMPLKRNPFGWRAEKGKSFAMLRPEDFKISKAKSAVKGKVIDSRFFGSHCELDIELKLADVTVRTSIGRYHTGDAISVSASIAKPWLF